MKFNIKRKVKKFIVGIAVSAVCTMSLTAGFVLQNSNVLKAETNTTQKRNIMYYGDWSIWGGQGNFMPQDIPAEKLTHLNFAFMDFEKNGDLKWTDSGASLDSGLALSDAFWGTANAGLVPSFSGLRARNENLKLGVSFGGWSKGGDFPDVASNDTALKNYVDQTMKLVEYMDLDFVDIDWEFPGSLRQADLIDNKGDEGTPNSTAKDKELFTKLLTALREGLDDLGNKHHRTYELSIALHGTYAVIDKGVDYKVFDIVDFANLMTYDMAGAFDEQSGHQTALYSNAQNESASAEYSINDTVTHILNKGVKPNKLVVGAGFYTRGWEQVANDGFDKVNRPGLGGKAEAVNTDADDSKSRGAQNETAIISGSGGRHGGIFGFRNILKDEQTGLYSLQGDVSTTATPSIKTLYTGLTRYWDGEAKAPYLYNATTGAFFTYEDEQSVGEKAKYVKEKDLGGIISWQQANDKESTAGSKKRDTLTNAIYNELFGAEILETHQPLNNDKDITSTITPYFENSEGGYAITIKNNEKLVEKSNIVEGVETSVLKGVETKAKTILFPKLHIELKDNAVLGASTANTTVTQNGKVADVDLAALHSTIEPAALSNVIKVKVNGATAAPSLSNIKEVTMGQRVTKDSSIQTGAEMRIQKIYGNGVSEWGVGKGIKWPEQTLAPFVDYTAWTNETNFPGYTNGGTPKLTKFYEDTNINLYNLGFITTAITSYPPDMMDGDTPKSYIDTVNKKVHWGWGGYYTLSEDGAGENNSQYEGIKAEIAAIRANGGDVVASFGGLAEDHFFQHTTDEEILYNTYMDIIKGYGLTRIDLDIEGDAQGAEMNAVNAKAIKRVQEDSGVEVLLTLAVDPEGLASFGVGVLNAYLDAGVDIKIVNLMTMCYAADTVDAGDDFGDASIKAVDNTKTQLQQAYADYDITLSDQEAYAKLGTNPSIGVESATFPTFTEQMMTKVVNHAKAKKLGMLSYWCLNRDAKIGSYADNVGVPTKYGFTEVAKDFKSAKPIEPKINGALSKTINRGEDFDALAGVSAIDKNGTLITPTVTGNVNTSQVGKYQLVYKAIDADGIETSLTITITVVDPNVVPGNKRSIMYYGDWSIWEGQGNFYPQNIPAEKLTHLNFAFMDFDAKGNLMWTDKEASINSTVGLDSLSDGAYNAGIIPSLEQLRARNKNLKLGVSFGGWSKGGDFVNMAKDDAALENYVNNTIKLVEYMDLDFVDIDWEFPGKQRQPDKVDNTADEGTPDGSEADKALFTRLLREVRKGLDKLEVKNDREYELSIALHGTYGVIDGGVNYDVFDIVDFANLMTYDMAGAYDSFSGHQTALYANADNKQYTTEYSIDSTVQHLLKGGVSPNKLVVGAGFYTRGWEQVANDGFDKVNRPGLGGTAAQVTSDADSGGSNGAKNEVPLKNGDSGRHGGIFSFRNIEQNANGTYKLYDYKHEKVLYDNLTRYWDNEAKAPYLYNEANGDFFTYDDEQSVAEKAAYVNQNGLGGMISWQQGNDKPSQANSEVRDTLTTAIYNGLFGGTELKEVKRKKISKDYKTELKLVAGNDKQLEITIKNNETLSESSAPTNEVLKDLEIKAETIMNPLLNVTVATGMQLAAVNGNVDIKQEGSNVVIDLFDTIKSIAPGESKSFIVAVTGTVESTNIVKSVREIQMSQRVTNEEQTDSSKYMRSQSIHGGALWGFGKGTKWPAQTLAPFVDMGLTVPATKPEYLEQGGVPKLVKLFNDTGVKRYNLGFINAAIPTGEKAAVIKDGLLTWGFAGYYALSERGSVQENNYWQYDGIKKSIKELRDAGGDVTVSFGGLNEKNLFQSTTDVDVLYNTYKEIVNGLGLTRIDLDIEGHAQQNVTDNKPNAQAIKKLQDDTGVEVVITLPVADYGLTAEGKDTLDAYINAGVDIKIVNLMTMCFGPKVPDYAQAAITAVDATKDQLIASYKTIGIELTDAQAYAKLGTNPSIGFEGKDHPLFTVGMHQKVVTHAIDKKLGMLSYWVMNRDALIESTDNEGIIKKYEFTTVSKQYPGEQEETKVQVSFDLDGGTSTGLSDPIEAIVGKAYGTLPVPTKAGQTFAGYKIDGLGTDFITSTSMVSETMAHTLKAMWTANKYTVNYDTADGDTILAKNDVLWSGAGLLSGTDPIRAGYKFKGWYIGNEKITNTDKYSELAPNDTTMAITLTAKWQKGVTISYDFDGGTGTPTGTVQYVGDKYDTLPTTQKDGYTFDKFVISTDTGKTAITTDTTITTDSDHTLKAIWTDKKYTVKYETGTGGTTIADKANVSWNDDKLLPTTDPTKTGYVFKEWQFDNKKVEATDTYKSLATNDTTASITLKAIYDKAVVVTFDYNGGTNATTTKNVVENSTYGTLPVPTRGGYTFDGYLIKGTTGIVNAETVVTETADHTLVAQWTANKYTVKYNVDGGDAIADKTDVLWNDTELLPMTNPTKTGYVFKEWQFNNKKVEATDTYKSLATDDTTTSITLKAIYNQEYAITFDLAGGTGTTTTLKRIVGQEYGTLPLPTKAGFTFKEYVIKDTTTVVNATTKVTTAADHVLVAQWTANKYTVKYNVDGGDTIADKTDVLWNDDKLLPTTNPTKTGYVFKEWQFDNKKVEATDTYKSLATNDTTTSITLKAIYDKEYAITFDLAGGTGTTTTLKRIVGQEYGTLPLPTKAGFTFKEYVIKDTTTVVNATTKVTTAADHELVAQWTANKYTVKYNVDGGDIIADKTDVLWDGASLFSGTTPVKADHKFKGWYIGDKKIVDADKYSELAQNDTTMAITLTAKWQKGVTISYDFDGGTGNNPGTMQYVGDKYDTLQTTTKTGYRFVKFIIEGDTDKTAITENTIITTDSDHVLKAIWTANKYTVKYNVDGGTTIDDKTDVLWDDDNLLPTKDPTKTGYVFKEWQFNNTKVVATDGYKFLATDDTTTFITLKAIYDKAVVVTFDYNGGTNVTTTKNVVENSTYGTLPVPTRGGYTFDGYLIKGTTGIVNAETVVTETADHTLVAQWTANKYTVTYNTGTDGTLIADKANVSWNDSNLLPQNDPTRSGFTFNGWVDGHNKAVTNTTKCSDIAGESLTINLSALWKKQVKVTYDFNGGALAGTTEKIVYSSEKYGTLATPILKGSTLQGYKVEGGDDTLITETSMVSVENDHTLVAQWVENKYSVVYDYDNDTANGKKENIKWADKGLLPTSNPTKVGYRFKHWVNTTTTTVVDATSAYSTLVANDQTSSVMLKAIYDKEYTITFDFDGGTATATPLKRIVNETYGTLPTPIKAGSTFKGYVIQGSSDVVEAATKLTMEADHVLVAQWVENKYSVVYDYDNATANGKKENIKWADKGLLPNSNPTKVGYRFKHWVSTATTTVVVDNSAYSTLVANDQTTSVTLKAIYDKEYTITFDFAGGNATATPFKRIVNETYGTLPTPTKVGSTFKGYVIQGSADVVEAVTKLTREEDHVLVAQWEANKYSVKYDVGSDGTAISDKIDVLWDGKDLIPSTNPTKPGYLFKEWKYDKTTVNADTTYSSLAKTADTKSITLTAVWRKEVQVSFDLDGGAGTAMSKTLYTNEKYGALPTTTKAGYTFAGYKIGGQGSVISEDSIVTNEEAHTLVAQWTAKKYSVIYDTDGGTLIGNKDNVEWENADLLPNNPPTKVGALFNKWVIDGTATTVTSTSTYSSLVANDTISSLTLKATYDTTINATINYNGGNGDITSLVVVIGKPYGELPVAKRDGYTFDGYKVDGKGNIITASTNVSAMSGHELVAQWSAKKYSVTYDSNGGSAVTKLSNILWEYKPLVPIIDPTRSGYEFKEWIEIGTGKVVNAQSDYKSYVKDDTVMNINLKAIWKKDITISFDFNGGQGDDAQIDVSTTNTYGKLPTPRMIGYNFLGYKTEGSDVLITNDTIVEIENDHKLVAQWNAKLFSIVYNSDGGTTIANKTGIAWQGNNLLPTTNPIRNGYTFVKWVNSESGITITNENTFNTLVKGDEVGSLTLKAVWSKNPVKFKPESVNEVSSQTLENKPLVEEKVVEKTPEKKDTKKEKVEMNNNNSKIMETPNEQEESNGFTRVALWGMTIMYGFFIGAKFYLQRKNENE